MRTLILSDLHLGSRSSRAEAQLAALERAVEDGVKFVAAFGRVVQAGTAERIDLVPGDRIRLPTLRTTSQAEETPPVARPTGIRAH